jgi:AcrR family transcriptional regulator
MKAQADTLGLRQRQAQDTRRSIVRAARALFRERGYGATTIAAIAARAGVAVPTIYKAFVNKPGVLAAIVESWRDEFVPGGFEAVPAEGAAAIAWWAHTARQQWETGYDIAMIFAGAVTSEPTVRHELAKRLEYRAAAVTRVAEAVARSPRPRLAVPQAAAIISALTLPEVYRELVHDRGWSAEHYEAWLIQTLTQQLLG